MIKAIVWDIGGVLLSDPQLGSFWKNVNGSQELRTLFGDGNISIEEFTKTGSYLLGISPDNFLEKYTSIYYDISPFLETLSLTKQLSLPQFILSDTNPIHGPYVVKQFSNSFSVFEDIFLSYEIGMRKNSTKIFEYVLQKIDCLPNEILFIDNKETPLRHAQEAGYTTYLYRSFSELKNYFEQLNLLN